MADNTSGGYGSLKRPEDYMSLPERHEALTKAQSAVRGLLDVVKKNPDDPAILNLLDNMKDVLHMLRQADDRAFIRYAKELGAMVLQPDYPHSIRAWYFGEFGEIIEDYGDDKNV
jgi:hypothetical protein